MTKPSIKTIRPAWLAAAILLGTGLPLPQAAVAAAPLKHYAVMVFSRPLAGKDTEFNDWYEHEHLPDMLAIPGFTAAQRFVTVKTGTPTSTLPPYLALYDVATRNLDATNAEVGHRMTNGSLRKGAAIDYPGIVTVIYAPLGAPQFAKQFSGTTTAPPNAGHTELKTFELIVFSNPVKGQEVEFNHWYDSTHVPDVLHVPGFISGQRFKLAENKSPGADIPRYLVRFEFESYDLDATIAEIGARIKSGQTRMSTTMAPDPMVYFDLPLGSRVTAKPAAQ
jgi:hypothetical protein